LINEVLLRLWSLPWPAPVREALRRIGFNRRVQRLIFPTFLVGVVGIVENEAGEVLLLRHTYRDPVPWGLPSGWIEHGEQPADALRRELREEAGFDVEVGPLWSVLTDSRFASITIVHRGRYLGGAFVPSREVSAAGFFAPHRMPRILEDQRRMIEASRKEEVRY